LRIDKLIARNEKGCRKRDPISHYAAALKPKQSNFWLSPNRSSDSKHQPQGLTTELYGISVRHTWSTAIVLLR